MNQISKGHFTVYPLLLLVLFAWTPLGCDWTVESADSDDSDTDQIEIIDIQVSPSLPRSGDVVTFTAAVAEGGEPVIQYRWYLSGEPFAVVTSQRKTTWLAPDAGGTYQHVVIASTESERSAAIKEFEVKVTGP